MGELVGENPGFGHNLREEIAEMRARAGREVEALRMGHEVVLNGILGAQVVPLRVVSLYDEVIPGIVFLDTLNPVLTLRTVTDVYDPNLPTEEDRAEARAEHDYPI